MLQDDVDGRRSSRRRACWSCCRISSRIRSGPCSTSGSTEQVRFAIRAVGHLRKRRLVGRVIERLGDPALVEDCAEALASFGDKVVGTLRDYLTDPEIALDIRREVPAVMLRVDTQAAIAALTECVQDPDAQIRFRVISALNKLRDQHPTWPFDDRLVGRPASRRDHGPPAAVPDPRFARHRARRCDGDRADPARSRGQGAGAYLPAAEADLPDQGLPQRLLRHTVDQPP